MVQVKEKVQHAVEQAEEDFVPKTHEEELQSAGYIPRCSFFRPSRSNAHAWCNP